MVKTFKQNIAIFWFRRDLRLSDNAGLFYALTQTQSVFPLFIFDSDILGKLEDKKDARVTFIYQEVKKLYEILNALGSSLKVLYGKPLDIFKQLDKELTITAVYVNHDYEPYARKRDDEISRFLAAKSIPFYTFKDQVIFEKNEVAKDDGKPYTVFTPFSRKWKTKLFSDEIQHYEAEPYFNNFLKVPPFSFPALTELGFEKSEISFPSSAVSSEIISGYESQRDLPSVSGTSRVGVHLRFGTISIRQLVKSALEHQNKFLDELIWREFYMMILWHFPHVEHRSFKPEYDKIAWRNNEAEFAAWCEGRTGYAIVDAGMHELNATGFMHNRVRMIVASFLVKHLLIDWRWGETYFAAKLLDYELASNNGGWQWAAGSGCDAAPYFRVFNPYLQMKKFDPDYIYIRRWIPAFDPGHYIDPIVDHNDARIRAINTFKKALSTRS